MANPTTGFGLRFARRLDGAALSEQLITRRIAYNESSSMFTGDLTQALADGYIEAYTAGDSSATVAGIFRGCKYLNPSTGYTQWFPSWTAPTLPSTTVVEAYLSLDPNYVYTIRSSGASALDIAAIGANFEVTVGAGNALTGQSTTVLLASSIATTATLPLMMVGLYQGVPSDFNSATLANNVVEVKLTTAQWYQTTGLV